jgi:lipoprotein-anchoring transpeptidase ErfK/SrfK
VAIDHIADAIFVDISARTLTWARGAKVLLKTTVAVGSPVSPTPKGYFFVTDVISTDPKSDYGAWVLALNGHSDAFTEFRGGDARIAIHGTDDPSSIGRAVSFGCVRVPAEVLAKLAAGVPIGTPVLIQEHAA